MLELHGKETMVVVLRECKDMEENEERKWTWNVLEMTRRGSSRVDAVTLTLPSCQLILAAKKRKNFST